MAKVPFLYISDHDLQGFQIFFNLKYGSRNLAFLSQTQTCSQLEWVGPTEGHLDQVTEEGSQHYIRDQQQNYLSWTPEEQEAVRQKWLATRKETVEKFVTRGQGSQFNKNEDTRLMRHWRESGLLEKEPQIAEEALEMERVGHGVWLFLRFSSLP